LIDDSFKITYQGTTDEGKRAAWILIMTPVANLSLLQLGDMEVASKGVLEEEQPLRGRDVSLWR